MTLNQAISNATRKASSSFCKYRVGAIAIDRKGNILGTARNTPRINRKGGSIHSEMALMKKYGHKIKTIIIFRVTVGGNLRRMDACPICAAKAQELGITIKSLI